MSLPAIPVGTTATISGQVVGGLISGWVLKLLGQGGSSFSKVSTDAAQILVLDATAGTFDIFISAQDSASQRNVSVWLMGYDGTNVYRLAVDVLQFVG